MNDNDRNERPETLAAILAEMRDYAERSDNGGILPDGEDLRIYADRIESAWKRDKSDAIKTAMMCKCEICKELQGNKATMREALVVCKETMCSYCRDCYDDTPCVKGCEALRRAKAALAAPARNCDKHKTADEAWDAWMHGPGCKRDGEGFIGLLDWLYAPAEGGAE